MKHICRRLGKLEAALTDTAGLVPYTPRWLEYWDRQYYMFLSGRDQNAIWLSSVAAYRAVMKYSEENPDSLVGRHWADGGRQNGVERNA